MQIKYIQLQGSSLCDGKCKICPYSHSAVARLKRTMSLSEFELILRRLRDAGLSPHKICLYLMSDSFFDKHLIERIEITHQYFPHTLIEVSSALGAGNKNFFEKLVAALAEKIHEIWISIHGINKETYETLCERDFNKIKQRAIKLLEIGGEVCNFKFVGCGASKDGRVLLFTPEQYKNFIYELIQEANLSRVRNIKISYVPFHNRAGEVQFWHWQFIRDINIFNPHFCCRPFEWLHVLADGRVVSCCMNYSLDQIWGNLFEQALQEIWNGQARKSYILKQLGFEQGEIPCKYCMSPGG